MDFTKLVQSKKFLIAGVLLGALIVLFLAFKTGVSIGYRKARFSYQWGENYDRNFGGPRHGIFGIFDDKGYTNAHGVSGQVIKINDKVLIVKSSDQMEKTVLISDSTLIRRNSETFKPEDLKVNDFIVTVGSPDEQGRVEAKLIRVMPEAAQEISGKSSKSFFPRFRR